MVNWGKLIFGGVDSSEYGIYITGEGVYNAPERSVEFVDIPGRNGAFAIDQGRYENIVVTYPAGVFGKDPEEFREALSDFRNAILSQKGYQRLEDTYHPEEFREAIYVAGIEVEPSQKKAGKFELTFNCKPQRWLTIGDYPIPIESGDVLQNPTVFDSSPLLEVEGYGTVSFNGYDIELDNSPLGVVNLIYRHSYEDNASIFTTTYHFDRSLLNTGDDIYVGASSFISSWVSTVQPMIYSNFSFQIENVSTMTPTLNNVDGGGVFHLSIYTPMLHFYALEPSDSELEKFAAITAVCTKQSEFGGGTDTAYITVRIKCGYDYVTYRVETATSSNIRNQFNSVTTTAVQGDSTLPILGHPTYIDCDIGEAYRVEDGEYKSCNSRVSLGTDLPTLAPGSNKITFDNTITDLKISPRWWRV